MNCPQCGKQMEYGHLAAGGYRIIWTPRERKLTNYPGADGILLQKTRFFGKNETHAWHCTSCRKIVVDY